MAEMRVGVIVERQTDRAATGLGNYGYGLAEALSRHPAVSNVTILHTKRSTANLPGHRFIPNSGNIVLKMVRGHLPLRRVLREEKLTILHDTTQYSTFRVAPPIPAVVTVHDLTSILFPRFHTLRRVLAHRLLFPSSLRHVTSVIVPSNATARDLKRAALLGRGIEPSVVPLAVDERFGPGSPDPAVLEKLGVSSNYFLYVGTIEPRKNLVGLIAAFERLVKDHPQMSLVVCGRTGWRAGPSLRALRNSNASRRIIRIGYADSNVLLHLYRGAKALVYPSFYEGFGLPVLEAMSCGTAVVTSNVSALPEVAGDGAIYCDPARPESIADSMGQVMKENTRIEIAERALQQSRAFSWEKVAEGTVRVYREALSTGEDRIKR